jgi:hypothetical protein
MFNFRLFLRSLRVNGRRNGKPARKAARPRLSLEALEDRTVLSAFNAPVAFDLPAAPRAVTETVNPSATTTTLSASPSSVVTGQSVVFTATVAALAPGAGTPTGTFTFFDGKVVLGTAPPGPGGKARLTRRFSVAGRYTIRAVHSGDSLFAASSQSIIEQVN